MKYFLPYFDIFNKPGGQLSVIEPLEKVCRFVERVDAAAAAKEPKSIKETKMTTISRIQNGIDESIEIYCHQLRAERRKVKAALRQNPKCKKLKKDLAYLDTELAELGFFGMGHISPNQVAEMNEDLILQRPSD